MASKFKVTPRQVRSKADELETLLKKFKDEVTNLISDNASLGKQWEGDARTKFSEEFYKDVEKFTLFANGIEQFIQQLRVDAEEYDKIESTNTEIARVRTAN